MSESLRSQNLKLARRKFLKLVGGVSGAALLSACGGTFVKPDRTTNDPLMFLLENKDKKMFSFLATMRDNPSVQRELALDPIRTLLRYRVLDSKEISDVSISKANRLLHYLLSNNELMMRIASVDGLDRLAGKYIRQQQIDDLSQDTDFRNLNASLNEVAVELLQTRDGNAIIEQQLYILFSDPGVQSILEIGAVRDLRTYTKRVSADVIRTANRLKKDGSSIQDPGIGPRCFTVLVCVAAVAIAIWKVAANVHYAANANVAANANAVINTNGVTKGSVPEPGADPEVKSAIAQQWAIFAEQIAQFAGRTG